MGGQTRPRGKKGAAIKNTQSQGERIYFVVLRVDPTPSPHLPHPAVYPATTADQDDNPGRRHRRQARVAFSLCLSFSRSTGGGVPIPHWQTLKADPALHCAFSQLCFSFRLLVIATGRDSPVLLLLLLLLRRRHVVARGMRTAGDEGSVLG